MILKFFRKGFYKICSLLVNNVFINWLLILFQADDFPKIFLHRNDWASRKYEEDKTMQENVGYSHLPYIQNLMDDSHVTFARFASTHLKRGNSVLDIGCGTGLFLKDLEKMNFELYGVDLNAEFLKKAQELVPAATLYQENFFDDFEKDKKFNLVSAFGVFMYIEPSRIEKFFDKAYEILEKDGYVFIQYIHALTLWDLLYPDITYIKYSPEKLEVIAGKKFKVVRNEHFYYGHKAGKYDTKRYFFPDGTKKRLDTIENSFLLILQKK